MQLLIIITYGLLAFTAHLRLRFVRIKMLCFSLTLLVHLINFFTLQKFKALNKGSNILCSFIELSILFNCNQFHLLYLP
jgi:hypothetical protein